MDDSTSTAPVTPTPTSQAPLPHSDEKKKYLIAGGALIFVILALAVFYSTYLGAKIAPGKKFRVLGPATLIAGQRATVTWDASPEHVRQFPHQKIEYCTGTVLKRKCTLLAAVVKNNGKAQVKVPGSIAAGKGFIRMTPRDAQRKLVSSASSTSKATVTRAQETASGGDSGGGGGDSGGGGGGGNNPAPTAPPDPYAPTTPPDPYSPTVPPDPYSP